MGQFHLSPLRGDRILQAYPLICATGLDISLKDWRAFVKAMLGARARHTDCCDIIGMCSSNGYLRALFSYQVKPDLHHGRTLDVEYFVVESIFSPRDMVAALMAAVEDEAARHDCGAIHAQAPGGSDWLHEMLATRDYHQEIHLWCKRAV